MSFLIDLLNQKIAPVVALIHLDAAWSEALQTSIFFRLWFVLKRFGTGFGKRFSEFGSLLQFLAFMATMLLFLVLAAPQFASDKEGLALIVAAALGARVLGTMLGGRETFRPCAIDAVVVAYLAVNLIATFSSYYFLPSLKGFAKMLVYVSSYFLFAGVFQHSARRAWWTVAALLFSGFLVALYGLYQYKIGVAPLATWEDPSVEEKTTRIYSTLRNPNLLAGYFVPLVPLSIAAGIGALSWKGWKKVFAAAAFAIGATVMVAVFLTGSRGGYIGIGGGMLTLALMLFCAAWTRYPQIRIALAACLVLAPLGLAFLLHQFPSYEHRVLSIFAGREHSSNSYRLNVYASSWKMFTDNWWLGIGPGNQTFVLAYGLYMKTGFDALGTYSVPLEIAVESGIVGLIVFALLICALLARAHTWFWRDRNWADGWLLAGSAAGIYALMLHGLVDTVFYRPQVQLIFWLLAAIIVGLRPPGTTSAVAAVQSEAVAELRPEPSTSEPAA